MFDGIEVTRKKSRKAKTSESLDVIVSRSHAGWSDISDTIFFVMWEAGKLGDALDAINGKATPAGGAGYKTLAVLEHNADVYIHRTKIKPWDVCAPAAIFQVGLAWLLGRQKITSPQAIGGDMRDWEGASIASQMRSHTRESISPFTKGLVGSASQAIVKKVLSDLEASNVKVH